jgi:hypothetical protein
MKMGSNKKLLFLSPATVTLGNYHASLKERAERPVRMARSEVARALQETVRVLRIVVSLHSAGEIFQPI